MRKQKTDPETGSGGKGSRLPLNVVERAIAYYGGQPFELRARLSEVAGEKIARQTMNGWRVRGVFPSSMILHVHNLTRIPLEDLLSARPKPRPKEAGVERAVAWAGSSGKLAQALAKSSGREITRQVVDQWRAYGKVARAWVLDVHLLTKVPIEDLMRRGTD